MSARRLADLSSSEVSTELARVGVQVSGKHVDDRERLLRLATFLIDKGQDPLSHEFPELANQEQSDNNSDKARHDRRLLLDRVVKMERRYFNFSVEASSSTEAAPAQDKTAFKSSLKRAEEQTRGL